MKPACKHSDARHAVPSIRPRPCFLEPPAMGRITKSAKSGAASAKMAFMVSRLQHAWDHEKKLKSSPRLGGDGTLSRGRGIASVCVFVRALPRAVMSESNSSLYKRVPFMFCALYFSCTRSREFMVLYSQRSARRHGGLCAPCTSLQPSKRGGTRDSSRLRFLLDYVMSRDADNLFFCLSSHVSRWLLLLPSLRP